MTDTALQQYLLLYTSAPDGEPYSREADDIDDWLASTDPKGLRLGGERLTEPQDARRIVKRDGVVSAVDGPFAEFKEWFVGFDLIQTTSRAEADDIASRHPCARFGRVYVLPLMEASLSNEILAETITARGGSAG